ncbi:hypothetical protein C4580_00335 [Candidatus Woesearchaeota archaeon]|nr:MAG: hypothetical protein C4580_00335 [Candidatus Woesearchaeota archaeon]
MRKLVIIALLSVLLLAACESKTVGKRVAIPETGSSGITAAVVSDTASAETGDTGKTAAEALAEFKTTETVTSAGDGPKSGTFYPPITTDATGKEALKAKTRALFSQEVYDPNVEAQDDFGPRYHDQDGDATNLPDGYSDSSGD